MIPTNMFNGVLFFYWQGQIFIASHSDPFFTPGKITLAINVMKTNKFFRFFMKATYMTE